MNNDTQEYDLIVIGGGPAGSTLASFVAMEGNNVLLLEKDSFPRYQIGESLLPATVDGICKLLGVEGKMKEAGFRKKLGGTFHWGADPEPWSFYFSNNHKNPTYAYQVERSIFDNILFKNATRLGVKTLLNCCVTEPIMDGDRVVGVEYLDDNGRRKKVYSKYVADASGPKGSVGSVIGERVYSDFFRNYTLFGYYENGKRLPGASRNNAFSAAFDGGWFWYIPISDEITSVGAVFQTPTDKKRPFEGNIEDVMNDFIEQCPIIKGMLSEAKRIDTGDLGKLRVRKDWSYAHSKFSDKGVVLVGDAACFVDPLLAQGVHMATYSALLAARSINSCLKGLVSEEKSFSEFEFRFRKEYRVFYEYLTYLYDMNSNRNSKYWNSRSLKNTQERGNEKFVQLLAGIPIGEEAYALAEEFFDDRRGFGGALEDVLNPNAKDLIEDKSTLPSADTKSNLAVFLRSLNEQSNQLRMLANFGEDAPREDPQREEGLVTSRNGRFWQESVVS